MPRLGRIVISGCPHHITQRGNNRQDVFFVDDDRRTYLELLREQAERFGVGVDGYCLMTNHVHLILTPSRESSLAKAVGRTHFLYTQYVNRFHGRSGHLWQNRFYSCPLDEAHFLRAMAYVEQNPARAKMVRSAWRYRWSSAAVHCGLATDEAGVLDMAAWDRAAGDVAWQDVLRDRLDAEELAGIHLCTSRGRPLGSDNWLSKLERKLGRRLRPLPLGRPKKESRK